MSMVLFVNACMRGEESRTLQLCRDYLYALQEKGEMVTEVNLDDLRLEPLTGEKLALRTHLANEKNFDEAMFDYARQLANADEVVIGAPYWDLSFPAALKTYIEHASIDNITFRYTPEGKCVGLCKAKHTTYITTVGGFVTCKPGELPADDPQPGQNLGYDYICAIAHMFGLEPVRYVAAEGLDVVGVDVSWQLFKAQERLDRLLKQR